MRFWQAIVVAQLTAGSIHADRYSDIIPHMVCEVSTAVFGLLMWVGFKYAFRKEPQNDEG